MDSHRQKEIARKGGRAAHEKGKAHEFTPDEARAAGRKGGEKVSLNRRHMAEIGRRGGRSSAQRRRPGANGGSTMPSQQPPSQFEQIAERRAEAADRSESDQLQVEVEDANAAREAPGQGV